MTAKPDNPVIIELELNRSREEVWEAITELEHMRAWFFGNIPAFRPETGFETRFSVKAGERSFEHLWKILDVEEGKKIVYDWRYTGYEGEGCVTFELFDSAKGTLLRLTNEGLDSFPRDIPEFSRESCEAGWDYFIRNNLKEYLRR